MLCVLMCGTWSVARALAWGALKLAWLGAEGWARGTWGPSLLSTAGWPRMQHMTSLNLVSSHWEMENYNTTSQTCRFCLPRKYTVSPLPVNLLGVNFQRGEGAPVCQLPYCTLVLFKVLNCKIKNVFFIFCVCFLCIICVKNIINLLQYSTLGLIVLVGYQG